MNAFLVVAVLIRFVVAEECPKPAKWDLEINSNVTEPGKYYRDGLFESLFKRSMNKVRCGDLIPKAVELNIDTKQTENFQISGLELKQVELNNVTLSGIDRIEFPFLRILRRVELDNLRVVIEARMNVTIEGHYALRAKAIKFIPLNGNGNFSICLEDVALFAIATLAVDAEDGKGVAWTEFKSRLEIVKSDFYFENLLGGGFMGKLANKAINSLGAIIVESQQPTLRRLAVDHFKSSFAEQL